jgi:hypothetical protein
MASYSDYLKYLRNADCACKYAKGDTGPQGPAGPPGVSAQGPENSVQYKDGTTSDLSGSANFTYDSAGSTVLLTATLDLTGNIDQAGNIKTQGTVDISGATTIENTLDVSSNATFRSAILMPNSIKIGDASSGEVGQSLNAIAIGNNAGNSNQGANSIAIGNNAGLTNQSANTIVINATGTALNGDTNSNACYIDPIRDCSSDPVKNGTFTLKYSTAGKEVTYDTTPLKSLLFLNQETTTIGLGTSPGSLILDLSENATIDNGSIAFYDTDASNIHFTDISNNSNIFLEIAFYCDASTTQPNPTIELELSGVNIAGGLDKLFIDTRSVPKNVNTHLTFGPSIYKFNNSASLSIHFENTYVPVIRVTREYQVSNCRLYLNAFRLNS